MDKKKTCIKNHVIRICLTILSALLVVPAMSCMVIPKKMGTRGTIDRNVIASLEEGITRRDQVLLKLGQPEEVREQERLFIYKWVGAADIVIGATGGSPGGAAEVKNYSVLLVEFDDAGIVQRVKTCRSNETPPFCQFDGSISPSNFYTNSKYKFSIQFPSEVSVNEFDNHSLYNKNRLIVGAIGSPWSGLFSFEFWIMSVAIHPITETTALKEVIEQFEPEILSSAGIGYLIPENTRFSLLESEKTIVSNVPAFRRLYLINDSQDSKDKDLILIYLLIDSRRLYQLTSRFIGKSEAFEKKRTILEEALQSFNLIDDPSSTSSTEPNF